MKKTFLVALLTFVLLFTTSVCAEENYGAEELSTYKIELTQSVVEISPKIQMQTFGETGTSTEALSSDTALPTKYRSPFVSPVKDQADSGNCWIFSIIGAAEGYMLKHYPIYNEDGTLKNDAYNFSENHMQYMVSNRYNNTQFGHNMAIGSSGHAGKSIPYFLNRRGPVDDSDDEFVWPYKGRDYSETANIPLSDYTVNGIAFIKGLEYDDLKDFNSENKQKMIDIQKKLILTYGSVACAIHSASEYYAESDKINLYYAPPATKTQVKSINHGVLAIGWDDDYPRENFKRTVDGVDIIPEGNGAFIIKNSWGEDSCENGFFYISYYDYYSTYDLSAITSMKPRKNDEILYAYDDFFPFASLSYNAGTNPVQFVEFGAQFRKKTKGTEELDKIAFYACGGSRYCFYLTGEMTQATDKTLNIGNNDLKLLTLSDGELIYNADYDGYVTVDIKNEVILKDKFSIIVLCGAPDGMHGVIPLEVNAHDITTAKYNYEETFFSPFTEKYTYTDAAIQGGSVAIKAITKTTEKMSDISFVNYTGTDQKEKENFNKGDIVRIAAVMNGVNIEGATLVCGIYKGNKLIKVLDKTIGNKENVFIYENIPEDFSEYTVRIFALDGYDNMIPLGNVISK